MRIRSAIFEKLLWCCALLWLMGCANVVPPTGGARDAEPPALIRATPEAGTLFFKDRYIKLEFNEYIKLQSKSNIRFTPALDGKAEFSERYNAVYIDLGPDSLRSNTTYTINFGDELRDLNENNKLVNFRYVFSTGAYLDSLEFAGVVVDAEQKKPVEGILIALYPDDYGDSAIYLRKPFYYMKTDKQGAFSLENMKAGRYTFLAFDDKNNSLTYQLSEAVAFTDSFVVLDTLPREPLELLLFEDYKANRRLLEKRSPAAGMVRFGFSRLPDSLHVRIIDSTALPVVQYADADTLLVYHQGLEVDSLFFELRYDEQVDTIKINNRKQGDKAWSVTKLRLMAKNQPSVIEPLRLKANRPLSSFDTSKVVWKVDTGAVKLPFTWEMDGVLLEITPELKPNKRYEIFIEQGALEDWHGQPVDSFRFSFSSVSIEAFGDLLIEDTDSLPAGITHLQLLDEQFQVLRTLPLVAGAPLKLEKLRPTGYRIRLLGDMNGNGKYDSGSLLLRRQPEPLWYLAEKINLRANWEVSVSLAPLRPPVLPQKAPLDEAADPAEDTARPPQD